MSRVLLVRLIPMIGKGGKGQPVHLELGRRQAACCESGPAGRARTTRPRPCRWTSRRTRSSRPHPRPVVERMLTVPGMFFIASSTGRVTVAIISSAGMTPLSIRITTRGKSVRGKTDEGILYAEYAPATHRADCQKEDRLAMADAEGIRSEGGFFLGSSGVRHRHHRGGGAKRNSVSRSYACQCERENGSGPILFSPLLAVVVVWVG